MLNLSAAVTCRFPAGTTWLFAKHCRKSYAVKRSWPLFDSPLMKRGFIYTNIFFFFHNTRYWSYVKPLLIHELTLYDVNVGVWWTVNAKRIAGHMFYAETVLRLWPYAHLQLSYGTVYLPRWTTLLYIILPALATFLLRQLHHILQCGPSKQLNSSVTKVSGPREA